MVNIFNAYFDFNDKFDFEYFKKQFKFYYDNSEYDKILLIIDLEYRNIMLTDLVKFIKIRKFFDNLGVEKLSKTVVICKDGKKKEMITYFLKKFPPERTVTFY